MIEKIKEDKAYRKQAYKDLKKAYKKENSIFKRFTNKITGKAPKWRKIKKYNSAELQQLTKMYSGNDTKYKQVEAQMRALGYSEKRIKKERWRRTVTTMNNKTILQLKTLEGRSL